jgi:hypothetical protein
MKLEQMEHRSQWNFESRDGGWVWSVTMPDGTQKTSEQAFKTLKQCADSAAAHGYVAWKAEEERRRDLVLGVTKALSKENEEK